MCDRGEYAAKEKCIAVIDMDWWGRWERWLLNRLAIFQSLEILTRVLMMQDQKACFLRAFECESGTVSRKEKNSKWKKVPLRWVWCGDAEWPGIWTLVGSKAHLRYCRKYDF